MTNTEEHYQAELAALRAHYGQQVLIQDLRRQLLPGQVDCILGRHGDVRIPRRLRRCADGEQAKRECGNGKKGLHGSGAVSATDRSHRMRRC